MKIVQFLPYFPPHKWGLETHAQQWAKWFVKKWFWEVLNVVSSIDQNLELRIKNSSEAQSRKAVWEFWLSSWANAKDLQNNYEEDLTLKRHPASAVTSNSPQNNKLIYNNNWEIIWYEEFWYKVLIMPCIDIVYGFPFPKFWTKDFWNVLFETRKFLKIENGEWKMENIIITRTRFFFTSFVWWLFAALLRYKWVHIEHWVDFVKLNSSFKTLVSYVYDQTVWRFIFLMSDKIVWVSEWCKRFVWKFTKKDVEVIHRGLDFNWELRINNLELIDNKLKTFREGKIVIWFIGRVVKLKWIEYLLEAFKKLRIQAKRSPARRWENLELRIELRIIWDGDELNNLKEYSNKNGLDKHIKFYWFQDSETIYSTLLPQIHIVVNPSFQEWLPTSIIEWILSWSVCVATDVWWTPEITDKQDLILVKPGNAIWLEKWLKQAIQNYENIVGISYDEVLDRFDWNKNIEKYFEVFKKVLSNDKW